MTQHFCKLNNNLILSWWTCGNGVIWYSLRGIEVFLKVLVIIAIGLALIIKIKFYTKIIKIKKFKFEKVKGTFVTDYYIKYTLAKSKVRNMYIYCISCLGDRRVSRAGQMPFHWQSCSFPFCPCCFPFLFFHSMGWCCGSGVFRMTTL